MHQIDKDYENHTYEELSRDFRSSFTRAYNLIPLMYKRLTQVEGSSYQEAMHKIYHDHKDLPGFSKRNIHRYLPKDLPDIPKRVVTLRHKSSGTEPMGITKLSVTKISNVDGEHPVEKVDRVKAVDSPEGKVSPGCADLLKENQDLKEENQDLKEENQDLKEALEENSKFTSAIDLPVSERVYDIPKTKWPVLKEAFKKTKHVCYVIFNQSNNFQSAEADTDRIKTDVSRSIKA